MLKYIALTIFIVASLAAKADPLNDFLNAVEREFDRASTPRRKAEIAIQFVSRDYLASLKDNEAIDPKRLTKGEGFDDGTLVDLCSFDKTCPLALSIVSGRLDLFRKFLPAVEDVNAFVSWGYRQKYSLAHVVLDPRHPKIFPVPLNIRLDFIDALGERNADFNTIFKGLYENPPLSAGELSGRALKENKILRVRSMLYGADPELRGSSFYGLRYMKYPQSDTYKKMMGQLFDWYAEKYDAGKGEFLCPTEKLKVILRRIAQQKGREDLLPSLESAAEKQKREQALLEEKKRQQEEAARLMREEEQRLLREEDRLRKIQEQRERERLEEEFRQQEEKARLIREEEELLNKETEESNSSNTQVVQGYFHTNLSAVTKSFLKKCILY